MARAEFIRCRVVNGVVVQSLDHKTKQVPKMKSRQKKNSKDMVRTRRSAVNKNPSLSLDDMLDVIEIVNHKIDMRGLPSHQEFNNIVLNYANKIVALSQNEKTKPRANAMIRQLNRRIVHENMKTSDPIEGKHLYNALMKNTARQCAK